MRWFDKLYMGGGRDHDEGTAGWRRGSRQGRGRKRRRGEGSDEAGKKTHSQISNWKRDEGTEL